MILNYLEFEFRKKKFTFQIVAARGYESNKPVNIFYGRRSNAEHLLHNGFVPEGQNSADRYKLKIGQSKVYQLVLVFEFLEENPFLHLKLIEMLSLRGIFVGLPRTDKNFQQKHKMIFDLGFAGWYESNIFMFDLANVRVFISGKISGLKIQIIFLNKNIEFLNPCCSFK